MAGLLVVCKLYGIALFEELFIKENFAVAIAITGFGIGLLVAVTGLSFGAISKDLETSLWYVGLEGLLAFVLLIVTTWTTDRLILHSFPVVKEISEDQNIGVASVVAGVSVASGIVINGSLCGYSDSVLTALRDVFLYWVLAQVAIWITLRMIIAIRPFDFLKQLEEEDNLASGVSLGIFVVCLGVLARSSIVFSGQESVWLELGESVLRWLVGIAAFAILIATVKVLLSRLRISSIDLELSNSLAPVFFIGMMQLASAFLLGQLIQRAG